jgi:hypothetical protein
MKSEETKKARLTDTLKERLNEEAEERARSQIFEDCIQGELNYEYAGEYDETPIIDYVRDALFWEYNKIDSKGDMVEPIIYFTPTLSIIKFLTRMRRGLVPKRVLGLGELIICHDCPNPQAVETEGKCFDCLGGAEDPFDAETTSRD